MALLPQCTVRQNSLVRGAERPGWLLRVAKNDVTIQRIVNFDLQSGKRYLERKDLGLEAKPPSIQGNDSFDCFTSLSRIEGMGDERWFVVYHHSDFCSGMAAPSFLGSEAP